MNSHYFVRLWMHYFALRGCFRKICIKQILLDLFRGIFRHHFLTCKNPPSRFFFAFLNICFLIYFLQIQTNSHIFSRSLDISVQKFTNFRWKSVEKQFVKVDYCALTTIISSLKGGKGESYVFRSRAAINTKRSYHQTWECPLAWDSSLLVIDKL